MDTENQRTCPAPGTRLSKSTRFFENRGIGGASDVHFVKIGALGGDLFFINPGAAYCEGI